MQVDTTTLLTALNAEQMADAIKAAGCAVTSVEQDGVVQLHSASHGVAFRVLWGTETAPGHYADLTLSCPLRVQGGALPDGLLAEWSRSKRFARLAQHGDMLVLEMDVIVSGGVAPEFLALNLQLWIQMMGQFFSFLRNFTAASDANAGTNSAAGSVESPAADAELPHMAAAATESAAA